MSNYGRRKFLKMSAAGLAGTLWAPLIQRALAVEAFNATRSIQDVKHIVILMQENRSFDHYFGAKKGVRGFGDRFPIPLASGQRVFHQSDGEKVIPPYRAHGKTSNAAMINGTPTILQTRRQHGTRVNTGIGLCSRHPTRWPITRGKKYHFNMLWPKRLLFPMPTTAR